MGFWSKLFGKKQQSEQVIQKDSEDHSANQSPQEVGQQDSGSIENQRTNVTMFNSSDETARNDRIALHEVSICSKGKSTADQILMTDALELKMIFSKFDAQSMFFPSIEVLDEDQQVVFVTSSAFTNMMMGAGKTGRTLALTEIPEHFFNAGKYRLDLIFHSSDGGAEVIWLKDVIGFEIKEAKRTGAIDYVGTGGATRPLLKWKIKSETGIVQGLVKKYWSETPQAGETAEQNKVVEFEAGTEGSSPNEWPGDLTTRVLAEQEASNDRINIHEAAIKASEKEFGEAILMTDPIEFSFEMEKTDINSMFFPTIEVSSDEGRVAFVTSSAFTNMMMGMGRTGIHHVSTIIPEHYFNAGKFRLDLIMHSSDGGGEVIWLKKLLFFEVHEAKKPGAIDYVDTGGLVRPLLKWKFTSQE